MKLLVNTDEKIYLNYSYQQLIDLGLEKTREGEVAEAIRIFEIITTRFPDGSLSHFYLGNLYTIQNKPDKALQSFTNAWERKNELRSYEKQIPYKTVFLLVTMEKVEKEKLNKWLKRATSFYREYSPQQKAIVDLAENLLEEE